ncbi:hypothetical protein WN51_13154 [Melipona quadrifasciata]|uniref:Uncharacterized protein n=1 Tax=Melipona quadrifasciata TaxID=166423 RepID=A0A0M9A2W9_9HYME|nr:hypothetical protein WN51_13154 [Melipona quadrifasciata]
MYKISHAARGTNNTSVHSVSPSSIKRARLRDKILIGSLSEIEGKPNHAACGKMPDKWNGTYLLYSRIVPTEAFISNK